MEQKTFGVNDDDDDRVVWCDVNNYIIQSYFSRLNNKRNSTIHIMNRNKDIYL